MSTRVLVADGDRDRSKAIVDACAACDIQCDAVTQGPDALEAALAISPSAIVLQLDLPLIDGPTLASILRANPRTRGIGLLFLGDRPDDAETKELDGDILLAPIDPEGVARRLQVMLMQREAEDPGPADQIGRGGVEGQLSQLRLADLLQLFHGGRKTGVVELSRGEGPDDELTGRVVLSAGDVIHAETGITSGEKALYRLIGWDRGSFTFRAEPVTAVPSIKTPTRALLREARRQVTEWAQLAFDLPPRDAHAVLQITPKSLPNVIHPLTEEVLGVLEGCSRVGDILDRCRFPDYQVLRTLHTLVERGIVALRTGSGTFGEESPRSSLFTPAQISRLRDWMHASRPRGGRTPDAKLLAVAADDRARIDFALLLEGLPDVELDARLAAGAFVASDFAPLGRVVVDSQIGIEIIHLPVSERFAPLWPAAGHGALGTIFLLSPPMDVAAAAVRPVEQELRKRPRARVFYVALLAKGGPEAAETLRQHFDLLDEGSLFLIPMEDRNRAQVLIRDLFARIVP